LNARRSRSEVVESLTDAFPEESVHRAIDKLITAGLVVETDAAANSRESGFWELAGLDADSSVKAVRTRPVAVVPLGTTDTASVVAAARSMNMLLVDQDAQRDLTIVVTDDLLHPGLARFNEDALSGGSAWLAVKPLGENVAVTPVFQAGTAGCWQCLASRVKGNRLVASAIQQVSGSERPPVTALADLPVTVDLAARLAVIQGAKWLVGTADPDLDVVTFDSLTLETRKHRLSRRPQCEACGDPSLLATQTNQPVNLVSRPKATTEDGGHRAKNPEQLLDTYGHLISPVTGVVSALVKQDTGTNQLHSYMACAARALVKA
jgi:ribosomal protein S12 methylthiotransferase accessory factor